MSFSGKAIPNGTDKHELGTPEHEGKFQNSPQFTVTVIGKHLSWLMDSNATFWVFCIMTLFIYLFMFTHLM